MTSYKYSNARLQVPRKLGDTRDTCFQLRETKRFLTIHIIAVEIGYAISVSNKIKGFSIRRKMWIDVFAVGKNGNRFYLVCFKVVQR